MRRAEHRLRSLAWLIIGCAGLSPAVSVASDLLGDNYQRPPKLLGPSAYPGNLQSYGMPKPLVTQRQSYIPPQMIPQAQAYDGPKTYNNFQTSVIKGPAQIAAPQALNTQGDPYQQPKIITLPAPQREKTYDVADPGGTVNSTSGWQVPLISSVLPKASAPGGGSSSTAPVYPIR